MLSGLVLQSGNVEKWRREYRDKCMFIFTHFSVEYNFSNCWLRPLPGWWDQIHGLWRKDKKMKWNWKYQSTLNIAHVSVMSETLCIRVLCRCVCWHSWMKSCCTCPVVLLELFLQRLPRPDQTRKITPLIAQVRLAAAGWNLLFRIYIASCMLLSFVRDPLGLWH